MPGPKMTKDSLEAARRGVEALAEHQSRSEARRLSYQKDLPDIHKEGKFSPIRKVGIRGVKKMLQMTGTPVLCDVSTYVNLKEGRGVHMSRFHKPIAGLKKIKTKDILEYLDDVKQLQEAEVSYLTLRFEKEIADQFVKFKIDSSSKKGAYHTVTFTFQIIATCPCSLEMCKAKKQGVPHMQRGYITSSVAVRTIEDAIPVVSNCIAEFRNIIPLKVVKRPVEHDIAVACEKEPLFVEDAVRRVKKVITSLECVQDFYVVAEHEESIHPFNAVAVDSKFDPIFHPME